MAWQSGEPKWKKIGKFLFAEFAEGIYRPGERFPTELGMGRRFGANRHSVHQAIESLAEENILRLEQGCETFGQEKCWMACSP